MGQDIGAPISTLRIPKPNPLSAVPTVQVYGPRDNLFMPNILEAGGSGMLRIFSTPRTGNGYNRVCFTHVRSHFSPSMRELA